MANPRHQTVQRLRSPRHSRARLTRGFWRGVGLTTVAVMALGASSAAAVVYRYDRNIDRHDASAYVDEVAGPIDPAAGGAINVLLIGSDSRDGDNEVVGGSDDPGQRSDTALIMHISADRSRVEIVSIPRDSLVDIPSCRLSDGTETWAQRDAMFNSAFSMGDTTATAAACVVNTVQKNTGVPIHHAVVADFSGFQQMVDALGGVDMCIPESIRDYRGYTGLNLPAGMQHLDGTQALHYARARYVTGADGSDTSRIDRQKRLLGAIAQKVLTSNKMTDAGSLLQFTSALTNSLDLVQIRDPLNLNTIVGIAYSLRDIDSTNIQFVTIPWAAATEPHNEGRVRWTSQADDVWEALREDKPIMDVLAPPELPASPAPTTGPTGPPATTPTNPTPTPNPQPTQVTSVEQMQQDQAVCPA